MTSARTPKSLDRERMPYDEIRRRYPRLLKRMTQVACLSSSEAVSAIADINMGIGDAGGCEAVSHFGGANRVVQVAWRMRGTWHRLELIDAKQKAAKEYHEALGHLEWDVPVIHLEGELVRTTLRLRNFERSFARSRQLDWHRHA